MADKKRKIKYEGILDLNGLQLPCYVLDDGTRVLSGNAMQNALKMVDEDEANKSGTRLARYLGQKSLEPYIYKDKQLGHFEPIECYQGKTKINGFEATVLADICANNPPLRQHPTVGGNKSGHTPKVHPLDHYKLLLT